ncbi:hypothetical protein [Enterococcus faecium]|uniref:hypothetical protein n=2 Tax=Enterococcus faecium TaxID=1352 RepID=UPI000CF016EE|nr:hypothetical protein [Enterococcus faecium]EGP4846776.1 hypothetical protein [Enterococcus faecium]EGP4915213.1 hypothetical protein [Enterococcus faecium]EGP5699537.1 hypothetical protein [Enterococcus faecium]EGP5747314.1 hypothetical protein [Enterococcus faecium]EME7121675.1 hypothetical protein [Enterococcus faecium]
MKILIYRFNHSLIPLIETIGEKNDCYFVRKESDLHLFSSLQIKNKKLVNFFQLSDYFDYLWIPDIEETRREKERILTELIYINPSFVKKVILSLAVTNEERRKLEKNFRIVEIEKEDIIQDFYRSVRPLNVPVSIFGSLFPSFSITPMVFEVFQSLKNEGYRVLLVTQDKNYAFWFGELLPIISDSSLRRLPQTLFEINYWFHRVVKKYSPEIVLFDCPATLFQSFKQFHSGGLNSLFFIYEQAIGYQDFLTLFLNYPYGEQVFLKKIYEFLYPRFSLEQLNFLIAQKPLVKSLRWTEVSFHLVEPQHNVFRKRSTIFFDGAEKKVEFYLSPKDYRNQLIKKYSYLLHQQRKYL